MSFLSPINTVTLAGKNRRVIWLLGMLVSLWGRLICPAAETNVPVTSAVINLATPAVMTGTFYEIGSERKNVLFKYRRAATSKGDLIQVEQTFAQPDGVVICRENILYRSSQLVSYAMEDSRAGVRGSIVIDHGTKKRGEQQILLDYIEKRPSGPKIHQATERLEPNTLISDTIYPYILTHWDYLRQGTVVKFHFISLDPATTLNFRLVKEAETNWQGRAVVRIKMEASNFIVAHWINPIYFLIEKAPPHRIFSYIGRTTPRALVDGAWKPMDAEAVFDWP
jgi:hypothetical protein